jgi:hypothetical protein
MMNIFEMIFRGNSQNNIQRVWMDFIMIKHTRFSKPNCYDFELYAISSLYSRSVLSKI